MKLTEQGRQACWLARGWYSPTGHSSQPVMLALALDPAGHFTVSFKQQRRFCTLCSAVIFEHTMIFVYLVMHALSQHCIHGIFSIFFPSWFTSNYSQKCNTTCVHGSRRWLSIHSNFLLEQIQNFLCVISCCNRCINECCSCLLVAKHSSNLH